MDYMLVILNVVLPLLYLAVLIDYGAAFFMRVREGTGGKLLLATISVHALLLVLRTVRLGYPPLVDPYEILSLIAISMALVHGLLEALSKDRRAGAFVFLLVFILQYISSMFLMGALSKVRPEYSHVGWAGLHAVPAVLAYTALAMSGVYGLLHVLAQRDLKRGRFGMLFDRLPALDQLGTATWHAMLVGFVFISISVATGSLLASHQTAHDAAAIKLASKIVIGLLAWFTCLVAVIGKLLRHWPAARVSQVAVGGSLAVMALLAASTALS